MVDFFQAVKDLSPVDIMEKLKTVTDTEEKQFYVELLNLKSKMAFERRNYG